VSTSSICPKCAQPLVVDGWPSWCESCGWGIVAPPQQPPTTRLGQLVRAAGVRAGAREEQRVVTAKELRPRLTWSKVAAYAIAVLVHLLALLLAVAGVALILKAYDNPFADVAGLMLIVTAWLMRPRFAALEKDAIVVAADSTQELHALLTEVAEVLDVRPPGIVVVDHRWNASVGKVGWRQRDVLTIGLPLLTALAPAERVALVAHELGHIRNGDARRNLVVATALNGLVELYALLRPEAGETVFHWIHVAFFWPLSRPVLGLLYLELHLLFRDSRRAEYLADAREAEVAGTPAAVSLAEIVLIGPAFDAIVARNVHRARRGDSTVFADLGATAANVTPRERERRRRIARLEDSRLDVTHPPTASRITVLESRPPSEARVVLGAEESWRIDEELARYRKQISERLIDDQRDRLFY